ncbi:E3 ubiquitin-protein ligase RNF216-like [Tenebrio molitor]|jgi:TRIAD3 protein (E3 ubiquitin-protein ligase RNF216)|uniref:E3 ubiquitin-protein ligase RNF216-like n=1 Tax=Tenebrio molitor TaxID=7067 RepID=UPI0036249F85
MAFEYKEKLIDLFYNSHVSHQQIDETIDLVLEENSSLTVEENLEAMINLLVESGDSTLEMDEDNASGVTSEKPLDIEKFNHYYNELLNMFPDICPQYLLEFCRKYDNFNFEQVVHDLIETDYIKMRRDPLDICEHLKQMLPNADPIYLRNQSRVLATRPPEDLDEFIENAIEKSDYPTMQEYLVNKELTADLALYLTNFSVNRYLDRVPDPLGIFLDSRRKPVLSGDVSEKDIEFALTFLYNQFVFQRKSEIKKIFFSYNKHLIKTFNKLKCLIKAFRHPRPIVPLGECKNVDLLQEISFLKHEKLIRQFLKQKDQRYKTALEEARKYGLLKTCSCCYDEELIPEECYFCTRGCIFCKDCVKSGAEHVIGKEETSFPCLADCDSEFDYSTLQMVLDTKTFQGVWHRKQIEEIRNANIGGLETCPFCDFCMIPDDGDKIFKCANIECMAETCRLCRHRAHIPKRCNEIEYDEDVKMRTFIENKMTEALLRKCWKCSKQFYKESGCNKMTCVCGAKMCYVCGEAVTDYAHFNQNRCALYTENLQQFHLERVLEGAESAKTELGITDNPDKLKFDPTRGIANDVA